MTIVTMNKVNSTHLEKVMKEAEAVGSVTINVYYNGEMAYALEGVHRTEAAKRLELPLILVSCDWDSLVPNDCQDVESDENGYAFVSAIIDYAYETIGYSSYDGGIYSDSEFVSLEVI